MKEKYIRVYYKTYKELRHFFPSLKGESFAEYFQRLIDDMIIRSEEK